MEVAVHGSRSRPTLRARSGSRAPRNCRRDAPHYRRRRFPVTDHRPPRSPRAVGAARSRKGRTGSGARAKRGRQPRGSSRRPRRAVASSRRRVRRDRVRGGAGTHRAHPGRSLPRPAPRRGGCGSAPPSASRPWRASVRPAVPCATTSRRSPAAVELRGHGLPQHRARGIDPQSEYVYGLGVPRRRDLCTWHELDAVAARRRRGLVEPRGGVVVGQRKAEHAVRRGERQQVRRRQGAVGTVGMAVQIDHFRTLRQIGRIRTSEGGWNSPSAPPS